MRLDNIVWTSVVSAVLVIASILSAVNQSELSIPLGLSSIAFAILSLRE